MPQGFNYGRPPWAMQALLPATGLKGFERYRLIATVRQ